MLAHFLRQKISDRDINAPSLHHLFGDVSQKDAYRVFTDEIMQWMEASSGKEALLEAEALRVRLPLELRFIGASGIDLARRFRENMQEFAEEVTSRYTRYTELMNEAAKVSHKKATHWETLRDDFMGQFLVNQLSRRGLIPTYSFPVHSLSLDVIQESRHQGRGRGNTDIALTRDASLGISEYAPGAEVVANGRIWTSYGLAHYSKTFMPERWYVPCRQCFNVDISDVKEEMPTVCSNCGSIEARHSRKFIEPQGFVTSYADCKGRDPGNSRRRIKAADEARLIAAPRDDAFTETNLPFLRTALLSSRAREQDGLRGTLFIANRGGYGEGYSRCPRCNFAFPIKRPEAKKKPAKAGKKIRRAMVSSFRIMIL